MQTAIYMRVSTDRQAKDGQSLEFQQSLLMDYIKDHNLTLAGTYIDDGVSGTKFDQRDELQRMLQDVKAGKIDLIIFTKLDRFFRSVRHLMNTLDILDQYGVQWKAVQENHDNSSPAGKLALTIMGAFAEMEANMGSVRVRDAFANKISKGEWLNNRPPCGYMIKNKKAVPDPELSAIVSALFGEYQKHGNLSKLVEDHLSDNVPHSRKAMKVLLKNRAYIGEAHGIEHFVEPIVSKDTFDDVQRLLSMNVKQSTRYEYIFSSLVLCPVCGKKMSAQTCKGKYARYVCHNYRTHACTYRGVISERKIESYLIENYKADLEKKYFALKSMPRTDNSAKIKVINHKIKRLKDLYVNDLIELEEYKKDLDKYKAELKELDIPSETNTEKIEKLLKLNVYEIYWTLTKEQKRRLWRSVIRSITPKDGSFLIEYL